MIPAQNEMALCEEATQAIACGDLHKAADICKSLLLSFPHSARGYHLTASLFHATGNYKKACDYSGIAASLDDCVVQYHMQQGQMLYILKEYAQAQKSFERVIEISGHDAEACRCLGNTLVAQEKFTDAQQWFAKARHAETPVDTTIDEAECALQSGECEVAETLLTTYIADHPKHAQAHYLLAILAFYAREFDRAETLLRKTLAFDANHSKAHFYLALLLTEQGDEKTALHHLLHILSIEPTQISALLLLGGIFMKQGDLTAAEKAFSHILALAPDHLLAWYSILELLHHQGREKEGMQRLKDSMDALSGSIPLRHLRTLFTGDMPPYAPREFITAFYTSFTDMFEPWVVATSHTPHIQFFLDELCLLPQLSDSRHASLLDLGCNTGILAELLANKTAIRVGIDIAPNMLKISRRSKQYDVLYELDIMDYVIGSEMVFDLVLSAGALRWIGNLQPFFQAVRGVMHKDSILACMLDKEPSTLAYSVTNHGSYRHHFSYISDVARAEGLQLIQHKECVSSASEDDNVVRHIFFFKKMTLH